MRSRVIALVLAASMLMGGVAALASAPQGCGDDEPAPTITLTPEQKDQLLKEWQERRQRCVTATGEARKTRILLEVHRAGNLSVCKCKSPAECRAKQLELVLVLSAQEQKAALNCAIADSPLCCGSGL